MTGTLYPQPIFEGAEKRLELDFELAAAAATAGCDGRPVPEIEAVAAPTLRSLDRAAWSDLLVPAECCILSAKSNDFCDAYLLSESSLFVYDAKIVLKTCGTTKILDSVPGILGRAANLSSAAGLKLARARYSRSAFKCPGKQPEPHTSFRLEMAVLDALFGHLKGGGHAYVLGDQIKNAVWHVYTAGRRPVAMERKNDHELGLISTEEPTPTQEVASLKSKTFAGPPALGGTVSLEICMTGLDARYCQQFSCDKGYQKEQSRERLRQESGIAKLIGFQDQVDDYFFDPCGYSMNAVCGKRMVTIHITPEEGFSYASVEFSGLEVTEIGGSGAMDAGRVVWEVARLFKPRHMYVAATCDGRVTPAAIEWCACKDPKGFSFALPGLSLEEKREGGAEADSGEGGRDASLPAAYARLFTTNQVLTSYGRCAFHTLVPRSMAGGDVSVAEEEELGLVLKVEKPSSPVTVLSSDEYAKFLDNTSSAEGTPRLSRSEISTEILPPHKALVEAIDRAEDVDAYARKKIEQLCLEDTFYVFDLENVRRRMATWRELLPRVRPFYAVKCNPDPGVLSTLADLGTGFDCASQVELDAVLSLGPKVGPDSVVYANACKRPSDLRHMRATRTRLTTFDSECELDKIKRLHPGAHVVLRIRADDPNARCYLGNKYGAEMDEVETLVRKAIDLDLLLVGVSFHVGSGASDPESFRMAIGLAREVFDTCRDTFGLTTLRLLDIGGGFSGGLGDGQAALGKVARVIRSSLDDHFPQSLDAPETDVAIIAEPGRYFSEGACTLYTCVYGKRERPAATGQGKTVDYWLTDGLYGSFNNVIYDHAELRPEPLWLEPRGGMAEGESEMWSSTLFGPTCDGLDTVMKDCLMPKMEMGDWVKFPAMGAYTISAASNFNGINAAQPKIFYVRANTQ